MISSYKIKEKATEYGIPASTIERDHTQNWLFKQITS